MMSLTSAQISNALKPYGVTPSVDLIRGIRTYIELLLKWNRSISLTTVTDIEQILRFHFGESLFALSMLPVGKSRLADVGAGAGFPGIPLAMASPNLTVTLIESNAKKYAFLNEVIRELRLRNVTALHSRMEEVKAPGQDFDIVTARALGKFENLLRWAQEGLARDGRIALWLGSEGATGISADSRWKWNHPVPIPRSQRRYILIGSPSSER
jgi:16S rRNA (guanine527-N7)-methyltransferase